MALLFHTHLPEYILPLDSIWNVPKQLNIHIPIYVLYCVLLSSKIIRFPCSDNRVIQKEGQAQEPQPLEQLLL